MTTAERQAHALLQKALPNAMVLAQVPFTRFLKVNGSPADLAAAGRRPERRPAAVRCLHPRAGGGGCEAPASAKAAAKRHERKARLLKAAGIRLLCWQEDALPDVAMIRSQLAASHPTSTVSATPSQPSTLSRPAPLIPVAEALEMADDDYAEGDGTGAQRAVRRTGARSAAAVASLSLGRSVEQQARANSRASKVCRSPSFSPTPMK